MTGLSFTASDVLVLVLLQVMS